MVQQFGKLLAQEGADDGRRCLVGSQTMGVGGTHDAGLQEAVVPIDTHERLHDEDSEAQVLFRRLAGCMEQHPRIGREAPVVVLSGTVDSCERLLVQECPESVLACHPFHERHEQHVMVHCQVRVLEDRGKLKLVGCHLVVPCLHRDSQHQGLYLQVAHESCHTFRNAAEVMVIHLLVLG